MRLKKKAIGMAMFLDCEPQNVFFFFKAAKITIDSICRLIIVNSFYGSYSVAVNVIRKYNFADVSVGNYPPAQPSARLTRRQ